jgi:L-asparaginase
VALTDRKLNTAKMLTKSTIPALGLGFILIIASITASLARPNPQTELPKVLVIATGGTIAGEQGEPGTLSGGYAIKKTISEVLALVPEVKKYAQIDTEQFSNISSSNITPDQWLQLSRRINSVLEKRADLAGVVITHGTDRLEETAFFLHLTVKSERPVVVVGAQRPPTGISPDGPLNLLSAIRVAASFGARGKGTMVVMDDRIISARDAQKLYARTGGFGAEEMGMIGIVANHEVEFFYAPARRHSATSEFEVRENTSLPRVDIHYSYAGSEGSGKTEAKGVVVASTGFGTAERAYYEDLQRRGVVVAMTFPSGSNAASPNQVRDSYPVIAVQRMLPTHARILLMLAFTKTQDPREIQRIFDQY